MKTLILRRWVLAWALAWLVWPAIAPWADENPAVPATTPTSDFNLDDVNGTAYHHKTGLTWKRCAEGQSWNSVNKACTGTATGYTWSEALSLASGGWRLPNIKELRSIVERRNWGPAINTTVFPNTVGNDFWSSSPYAPGADFAWGVALENYVPLFETSGRRAPSGEAVRRIIEANAEDLEPEIDRAIAAGQQSATDTHPPTRERIARFE